MVAARNGTVESAFELLLKIARVTVDQEQREEVRSLTRNGFDWDRLVFLSRYHRVAELAYSSLRACLGDRFPEAVERTLRGVTFNTAAYNMLLVRELGRMKRTFEREALPFLTFKGPVLAQTAYGDLGLRGSVDLDLLVRGEDYERLQEILATEGYRLTDSAEEMSRMQRSAYLRLASQMSFVNPERMMGLDVHTDVMPPGYFYPHSFDALMERSQAIRVGGEAIPSFQSEDMLQLLCFHGVKNRWDQLKYVCDVREFIVSHPELDWDVVMRRAEEIRAERVLYSGLEVARVFLDAPLPADVVRRIDAASYTHSLRELTLKNLMNSHQQMLSSRERIRFHLGTQDDLRNRARYVLYSAMRHVGGVIDI